MSNWFYESSLSHKGLGFKKGKKKSKTGSLVNTNIKARETQRRQSDNSTNSYSRSTFGVNNSTIGNMRNTNDVQRNSPPPPVKGWDMLKPENRPTTNSSSNDWATNMRSRRDAAKNKDYNYKVAVAEKKYRMKLMALKKKDRRRLEEFLINAEIKISLANPNGASLDEMADIEGLRAAINHYKTR